jgi:integrase
VADGLSVEAAPVTARRTRKLRVALLHSLLHSRATRTHASVALARGIHPKVVQEAMGHTSIATTLDLYSHVVPTLQRDAAREMGAALLG